MIITCKDTRLTVGTFRDGAISIYLESTTSNYSLDIVIEKQDVINLFKRLKDHLEGNRREITNI